jgi:hypothetical protein
MRVLSTYNTKCLDDCGIGDVHAIPGYQEVHPVRRRDRDVRRVRSRLSRDYSRPQNVGC